MPRGEYDEPLKVVQVAGRVGRDPESYDTRVGEVLNFTLAQTLSYGDDDDSTKWWRISVWREDLQEFVRREVQRGSPVVVEGKASESEYKGEVQYELTAYKVGVIDWNMRPQTSDSTPRRGRARSDEEEDL